MLMWERNLNALIIFILCGILLAAFGVQFIEHEEPCPLCLLQRLGMIAAGTCLLFNLLFGIHPAHYGLALLSSLFGGTVALRQISLHVCPGFPEFGLPVLGISLYTWSFLIFFCLVLSIAFLLILYNPKKSQEMVPLNPVFKVACGLLLFVVAANIVTTYAQCGFGPCTD